jgi:raffinose/stachyose/melibiose transport system permease protein
LGVAVLLLWSVTTVYPLVWTFFTSLKTNQQIYANTWGLPSSLLWQNYPAAVQQGGLLTDLVNSVVITTGSIVILFFLAPMAAYVLGRSRFLGKRPIFYAVLAGMYITPQVALVPMYTLLSSLSLIDTYLGLILIYVASGLPYCIFISRLGFLSIPASLEESGRVDGMSTFQRYRKIALPLAMPTVLIAMILEAIFIWNDFLFPLVFIRSSSLYTLQLGLFMFQGSFLIRYGLLAAGVIFTTVPLLVLYIIFSTRIKKGIAASLGIKG